MPRLEASGGISLHKAGAFNAGDFGKILPTLEQTNLVNADVMQVFQSAIYLLDIPPSGSDLFDAMDSCGYFATTDPLTGLLVPYTKSHVDPNAMFDGNDLCINSVAFGDGVLDVCDVFVTFRRSLDPSLALFQRFFTNGTRVAQIFRSGATTNNCTGLPPIPLVNRPTLSLTSADVRASAGQMLQTPVAAADQDRCRSEGEGGKTFRRNRMNPRRWPRTIPSPSGNARWWCIA